MTDEPIYTRGEVAAMVRQVATGSVPECPRCSVPLTGRAVAPDAQVAYVRRRSWWICSRCRRSAVLDEPRRPPGTDREA